MIRVITIEREYGSGAADIAKIVAERLGWKLWDQLLTNHIARLLDCDSRTVEKREEKRDPVVYRLFRAFMRGSYEGSLNAPRLKMVDADCIREVTERVVKEAAEEGNCVIVGRGSAYYLQSRNDAFHVFIYAPFEKKVRRLQAGGTSESEAVQLAETVDRDRADFIKQYFGVEWPDRHRFHLMINSSLGDEWVVQAILNAAASSHKPQTFIRIFVPLTGGIMVRDGKVRHVASSLAIALLFLLGAPRQSAAQIGQPAASPPAASQNPLLGSVPTGQASPTPVALSLKDALGRALKYNLGAIEADEDTRAAHAARLRNLNALLPNLSARVTSTVEEINLRTVGFFVSIPGVNIPSIVGPFGVADARFIFSQQLFNWSAFKSLRASSESEKASQYAYKSDRDLVVLTTVNSYLLVIADAALVDSIRAQVLTAQTLFQKTSDQHTSGVVASIDVLRSQVELQNQQQRLIASRRISWRSINSPLPGSSDFPTARSSS